MDVPLILSVARAIGDRRTGETMLTPGAAMDILDTQVGKAGALAIAVDGSCRDDVGHRVARWIICRLMNVGTGSSGVGSRIETLVVAFLITVKADC